MPTRQDTNVIYFNDGRPPVTETVMVPTRAAVLTKQDFKKLIIVAFGGNGAAKEKFQTYIDAAVAEVGTNGAAKRRRMALDDWRNNVSWTRAEALDWLDDMQFSSSVPDDKAAVRAAWPEQDAPG